MQIFGVEKINGEIIVKNQRGGSYRANSAEEIKRALSELEYIPPTAEVRMGKIWYPLKRPSTKRRPKNIARPTSHPPEPQKVKLNRKQRILKALGLYKDPLERLLIK